MSTAAAAVSPDERGSGAAAVNGTGVIQAQRAGVSPAMTRADLGALTNFTDARIASPAVVGMMPPMTNVGIGPEATLEADVRAVAQSQDRAAFARIFAFYGPRVKAYLRRLGAEDAAAEDLTQEVMLSIWRRAHQFDRSRAALSTWIYTIARNRRIDALRRERRPDFDPEDPALVGDNELAPRGDHYAEGAQARREVMRAVERLPVEQAQLLRIFYFEEKPHSVIAEELGLPLGTVKSRLRLALGKLRVLLNGFDG
jgi:RNA polymerase sigma factor (sigma-70 family)